MNRMNRIAEGIFVVGLIFAIIGVLRGEHMIVLQKAIRICLECIGLA